MHEQAVGFINGCSRTGEREALGALMRLMPLNAQALSGDYGSRPKKAENYPQI